MGGRTLQSKVVFCLERAASSSKPGEVTRRAVGDHGTGEGCMARLPPRSLTDSTIDPVCISSAAWRLCGFVAGAEWALPRCQIH